MSIVQVVAVLADVVDDNCKPLTDWEERLVRDLQSMPQHLANQELDRWELQYQTTWGSGPDAERQSPSIAVQLVEQIFEFGCFNLYCQFQPVRTTIEYWRLIRTLNRSLGTSLKANRSVLNW